MARGSPHYRFVDFIHVLFLVLRTLRYRCVAVALLHVAVLRCVPSLYRDGNAQRPYDHFWTFQIPLYSRTKPLSLSWPFRLTSVDRRFTPMPASLALVFQSSPDSP